jgi:hypothetical protein
MGKQKKAPVMELPPTSASDVAVRLLYIQQRIEALERLYNEEVSNLRRDVSEMKLAVLRQAQSQGRLANGLETSDNPDADE